MNKFAIEIDIFRLIALACIEQFAKYKGGIYIDFDSLRGVFPKHQDKGKESWWREEKKQDLLNLLQKMIMRKIIEQRIF